MDGMIDLSISPEEQKSNSALSPSVAPAQPTYPWGLCLRFDDETLKKLNVDYDDWEVGDVFTPKCAMKLTSKSETDTADGKKCNVEFQIIAIEAGLEENEENEENEAA